jgi:hypothetical protein
MRRLVLKKKKECFLRQDLISRERAEERIDFFLECLCCANDIEAQQYALSMVQYWTRVMEGERGDGR